MKLYIKYMLSLRCKLVVKNKLHSMGINLLALTDCSIKVMQDISDKQITDLQKYLLSHGLVILDEPGSIILDNLNNEICQHVNNYTIGDIESILPKKLQKDYDYLNKLFSDVYGISIHTKVKQIQIEKVKELLLYEDLNLKEITKTLHYKNTASLAYLFKKITGLTPAYYKKLKKQRAHVIQTYSNQAINYQR